MSSAKYTGWYFPLKILTTRELTLCYSTARRIMWPAHILITNLKVCAVWASRMVNRIWRAELLRRAYKLARVMSCLFLFTPAASILMVCIMRLAWLTHNADQSHTCGVSTWKEVAYDCLLFLYTPEDDRWGSKESREKLKFEKRGALCAICRMAGKAKPISTW